MVEQEKQIDMVKQSGYFVDKEKIMFDKNMWLEMEYIDDEHRSDFLHLTNGKVIKCSFTNTSEIIKRVRTLQRDIKKYGLDKAVERHTQGQEWVD